MFSKYTCINVTFSDDEFVYREKLRPTTPMPRSKQRRKKVSRLDRLQRAMKDALNLDDSDDEDMAKYRQKSHRHSSHSRSPINHRDQAKHTHNSGTVPASLSERLSKQQSHSKSRKQHQENGAQQKEVTSERDTDSGSEELVSVTESGSGTGSCVTLSDTDEHEEAGNQDNKHKAQR